MTFIDPKAISNGTQLDALLDVLDANGGPDRFVAKYYGVVNDTTSWMGRAKARGYKTWGYFYTSDSANFSTYAPKWTYVGIEYSASNATVNSLMAAATPGAKLIAHICPTPASVNTARAWTIAPDGFMVSGTGLIVPNM